MGKCWVGFKTDIERIIIQSVNKSDNGGRSISSSSSKSFHFDHAGWKAARRCVALWYHALQREFLLFSCSCYDSRDRVFGHRVRVSRRFEARKQIIRIPMSENVVSTLTAPDRMLRTYKTESTKQYGISLSLIHHTYWISSQKAFYSGDNTIMIITKSIYHVLFHHLFSVPNYFSAQKSMNACVSAWNRRIGERMRRRTLHHASIRALPEILRNNSHFPKNPNMRYYFRKSFEDEDISEWNDH